MPGPPMVRSPGFLEGDSGIRADLSMNTVCEVCGNIGYKRLLVGCRRCNSSVVHLYCLEEIVFDASLVEWWCYECLQWRSEVTRSRFLEKAEDRCQQDYRTSNELPQRRIDTIVTQSSILQKNAMDKCLPHSPNDGCEKLFSCAGFRNNTSAQERSADSIDISSSSQHDNTESSESIERFIECRKGRTCHRGKTINKDATSSSSEFSGEDIPSSNDSLESDDPQAPSRVDYVLSYRSYISEVQKQRIAAFIQEIRPEITIFVAVMQKRNIQLPCSFLGISKEYAFAHFPHESTHVTLEMPSKSKKWHPKFHQTSTRRKLMGQWLDFVQDNHVQEGDICLLFTAKSGRRSTFMVYLLCATGTHSIGGAGFQRVCPCSVRSCAKTASGVHIMDELANDKNISLETDVHKISEEYLEIEEPGGAPQPPNNSLESDDPQAPPKVDYVLSHRSYLSEDQKQRLVAFIKEIRPQITIFVAVMQKRNIQPPGPVLGISKEYAFQHFPHESTHVTLQMPSKSKKWHPKFHKTSARRKLMGQWLDFVQDNHVEEGDICLLFPAKSGRRSTFMVHLLCATATHSIGGAGFQRVCPCPGRSCANTASGLHIMDELTNDEHIFMETDVHGISDESLEMEDPGGVPKPPYIVPSRNSLSKSQKEIVEERVQSIQSEVPICVAVMKNNNVGDAEK